MKKKSSNDSWVLPADVLAELRGCEECKEDPAVFLTSKKIPCCRMHWDKFADGLDASAVTVEIINCQLPGHVLEEEGDQFILDSPEEPSK